MHLYPSDIKLSRLEDKMRIGNWFHAQGQNYMTWRGLFICDDIYIQDLEYECDIRNISENLLFDMLKMSTLSPTPNHIRHLFDFDIFYEVDCSNIIIESYDSQEWDAESWASRFNGISEDARRYNSSADRNALRTMRIDVFTHTQSIARQGFYRIEDTKINLPSEIVFNMEKETRFYDEEIHLPRNNRNYDTSFSVVNEDCLVEARRLKEMVYNVAVLNMASRQNPGGGVLSGAGAQEENLFRRSNLFQSLYQFAPYARLYGLSRASKQYPLDRNYGGIYSPDVFIFRGSEAEGYPLLKEPYLTSITSVAAINRPELTDEIKIVDFLVPAMKSKIRTILRIGIENRHDTLVLGAFGCGAFRNHPQHVAQLFHEVLLELEFRNRFRHIFAILEDHNSRLPHNQDGNFQPFYDEFN